MVTGRRCEQGGVVQKYPEALPFLLATGVEAVMLVILVALALR
jgi:hypothetical protein